MFGWIKESAVYEVGFIGSSAWDEESSSYKVTLPKEVLEEAVRVIDKGYLFLVHGTIVMDGGSTEMYLQTSKVERQVEEGVETVSVSFADGSTLTENLLTVKYGEGESTQAIQNIWDSTGEGAVAGGTNDNTANGSNSLAFGLSNTTNNTECLAFGFNNTASAKDSGAIGNSNETKNSAAFAIGNYNKAYGYASFVEGNSNTAGVENNGGYGQAAHAEGYGVNSRGNYAHGEGYQTNANGESSHTEGRETLANGSFAHAEGYGTIANGAAQHVGGAYNIADNTSLEIIGNGGGNTSRSNARKLDLSGNEYLAGQIQPENGLRLKAPNGTYYNVTVDNTGSLSIVAAT